MDYRRAWHKGGTYFFTVNCLERKDNYCLVRNIDLLREVIEIIGDRPQLTDESYDS